jgi:hypothetical protein
MLEKPVPMPVAFQATAGPPAGHCFRSPVSADWASRRAPRNWFQSRLAALGSVLVAWRAKSSGAPAVMKRKMRANEESFTIPSPTRLPSMGAAP